MKTLELREHRNSLPVELSRAEIVELQAAVPAIGIRPSLEPGGLFEVRPGSYIGSVRTPLLRVEIRPKLEIRRLMFLLAYTSSPSVWQQQLAAYGEQDDLVEAVAAGFAHLVRRVLRQGLLQGYRVEEDALQGIRGRLRFDDQLRRRFGRFPPAEVRYDEFTVDIEENRLLRGAVLRLLRLAIRSVNTRRALRALDEALAQVTPVRYSLRALPEIHYTRLNRRYQPAIELAKRVLRSTSFELGGTSVAASGFLLDMNQLFEDFVVIGLREALRLSDRAFPQNCRGHRLTLDSGDRVKLEPDISWWNGRRCSMVGDVKYKRDEGLGHHADLYQLLAYVVATGLPAGLLIYAKGEAQEGVHLVRHLGRELHISALDLAGQPEDILEQLRRLAVQVRAMRDPQRRVA